MSENVSEEECKVALAQSVAELLTRVREQAEERRGAVSKLRNDAQALTDASRNVEESFSGSNFGYHSELYYRDFRSLPWDGNLTSSGADNWDHNQDGSKGLRTRLKHESKLYQLSKWNKWNAMPQH